MIVPFDKILLLIIITVSSIHQLLGQDTKFVSRTHNLYTEEYYVLKSDKNIRHGSYVKYKSFLGQFLVFESGFYENGLKHGLWEYYGHSSANRSFFSRYIWLKEKGYYAFGKKNGVWSTYYFDTTSNEVSYEKYRHKNRLDSVNIYIDQVDAKLKQAGMYLNDKRVGDWVAFDQQGELIQKYNFSRAELIVDLTLDDTLKFNTNRPALFIGGQTCLKDFLNYNLDYGNINWKNLSDSSSVEIFFTIDEFGNTGQIRQQGVLNSELVRELERLVSSTDGKWLPALKDKKKLPSVVHLQFTAIILVKQANQVSIDSKFIVLQE